MNARRLGCLSGSSLLAVALTLLLALGVTLVRGGRWFSPGPLNAQASGAELGGVTSHAATGGRCQACHTAPWDRTTLADRCLACHTAINDRAGRTHLSARRAGNPPERAGLPRVSHRASRAGRGPHPHGPRGLPP